MITRNIYKSVRDYANNYPGLTQREVAAVFNISKASVSRIINCKTYKGYKQAGLNHWITGSRNLATSITTTPNIKYVITTKQTKKTTLEDIHKDVLIIKDLLANAHTYNIDDIPRPARNLFGFFRRDK